LHALLPLAQFLGFKADTVVRNSRESSGTQGGMVRQMRLLEGRVHPDLSMEGMQNFEKLL